MTREGGDGAPRRRVALLLIVLLALAPRLAGAFGDLWLDEVWSVEIARTLSSPWWALGVPHDNNHLLNTTLLRLLLPLDSDVALRLPSVIAGVASAILAGWLAATDGATRASPALRSAIAAGLVAGSYLLVVLGCEARGYALAEAATLLALVAIARGRFESRSGWAAVYGAAAVVGMLAHGTALVVPVAGFAAALVEWRRQARPLGVTLRALLAWHAVPVGAAALLVVVFYGRLRVGGAPASLPGALGLVTLYGLGLPEALGVAALGVAAPLAIVGLLAAGRRGGPTWPALAVLVVLPLVLAALRPGGVVHLRYGHLSALALLLLSGELLSGLAARPGAPRALAVALGLAFAAGNLPRMASLVRLDHGESSQVARHLAEESPPVGSIAVAGDVRTRLVLEYFAPRSGLAGRLVHVPMERVEAGERPTWLLLFVVQADPAPPAALRCPDGEYVIDRWHGCAPMTGLSWLLFRWRPGPSGG